MRTTLTVDDAVLKELIHFTGAKTRTEAVRVGLNEYVRAQRLRELRDLRGKVKIDMKALGDADNADVAEYR